MVATGLVVAWVGISLAGMGDERSLPQRRKGRGETQRKGGIGDWGIWDFLKGGLPEALPHWGWGKLLPRSRYDNRSVRYDNRSGRCDDRSSRCDDRSVRYDDRSVRYDNRSSRCDDRSVRYDDRSGRYDDRSGRCDKRSGHCDNRSGR